MEEGQEIPEQDLPSSFLRQSYFFRNELNWWIIDKKLIRYNQVEIMDS